jgi:16S rRNA (adenine1518-N6/adenine1519-N6)-dimethyltransferase
VTGLSAETRALLAREGLAPRKRLGQNFLVDERVVGRMLDLAAVTAADTVLEIGPGLGALTDGLAVRAGRLYVIEYDRGLAEVLRRKFAASTVTVVEGDALEVDLGAAIAEPVVKVVASLPYNVAVPILFRLLEERRRFPDVTVMVQHEIAERLVASPGSKAYGAPSVLFQLHATVRGRFRVGPAAFYPRPRVTSEVLRVALAAEPCVPVDDERTFRAVVRAAFGQRRKMLRNALQAITGAAALSHESWERVFALSGIDGKVRGETLDVGDFATLANAAARVRGEGGARPPRRA